MGKADQSEFQISRVELFQRVWSKPMTTNALDLKTSTSVLSALARRLALPLPRSGHWMKREVGKEPPTPSYPSDPLLDAELYSVAPSPPRKSAQQQAVLSVNVAESSTRDCCLKSTNGASFQEVAVAAIQPDPGAEHRKVARTRKAIGRKGGSDREMIGGRGYFRLLLVPDSGARACAILDKLVATVEAQGWKIEDSEEGYAIVADGETVGFVIEEKLDRVPHAMTTRELKEKAEYDRKCALADRGIGYRGWPPSIPEYDYVPNGELILKFDKDYNAGSTRRNFSDGKRQRLEDLIPSMITALESWSVAVKVKREQRAQWERDWAEQERRRHDRERQARVEGYRIAFLQRQIERKREIDGLSALIATWEQAQADAEDAKFMELLEFARLYRERLEEKIGSPAVAERIRALKLMDDDVTIYDVKRID